MKTVDVSLRSRELKGLLDIASHEDVVLRTPEGEEFLLSSIDDFDVELAQQRKNKKLMTFLDKRFAKSRLAKGVSLSEAKKLLDQPSRNHG